MPRGAGSGGIPTWEEIYKDTPNHIDLSKSLDEAGIRRHLEALQNAFHANHLAGKPAMVRAAYRPFADDLYRLQQRRQILGSQLKLVIPPHAQVQMELRWFCLNLERHIADEHEYVSWIKGDPQIPYYSQLLLYADSHRTEGHDIQMLLWNLQRKVPYSSYPQSDQQILREIDPNAPYKLGFYDLRHLLAQKALQYAQDTSVGKTAGQAVSLYRDYSSEIENLLKSHSSQPIPHQGEPQLINADPLFATSLYSGFSMLSTFYNTANLPFTLDLSRFYLNPARTDVQRQALLPPQPSESDIALQAEMEQTDRESRPYITPIAPPGPMQTADPALPTEGTPPYITPVAEPGPVQTSDPVPPTPPPPPYITPVSPPDGGYLTADSQGNTQWIPSIAGAASAAVEQGLKQGSILIGETMPARVVPVAQTIGAGYYVPTPGTPKKEWLARDRSWFSQQIQEGNPIYDIGIGPNRPGPDIRSEYYRGERQELSDAGYAQHFVKDITFRDPKGKIITVKLFEWIPKS